MERVEGKAFNIDRFSFLAYNLFNRIKGMNVSRSVVLKPLIKLMTSAFLYVMQKLSVFYFVRRN